MYVGKDRVVRQGGKNEEVVLERMYLCARRADGSLDIVPILREPQVLPEGKDAWPHVYARKTLWPVLKVHGHLGTAVYFYIFDRSLYAKLRRLLWKFHAHYLQITVADPTKRDRATLETWVVTLPCGNHGGHNSLHMAL
jgi:hypothetical protein